MEIPYELLIKYCRKQVAPEENQFVKQWLAKDDNSLLFSKLKNEWIFVDDMSIITPDKQLIWQKMQAKINIQKKRIKRIRFTRIIAAASVALAIVSVSSFLYFTSVKQSAEQYTTIHTKANEKQEILLPDGTKVWLNSNSTLSYNNLYNTTNREVSASGELFFDVTPSSKKFIINTEKIRVEVLGTSFNLKTIENENIEISLKKGKVAVFNTAKEKLLCTIQSSQTVVIEKDGLNYVLKTENDYLSDVWIKESLDLYNEPLNTIFDKLEVWYGIEIVSKGIELDRCYTFHLEKESLPEFLEIFSAVIPIKYSIEGKKVTIEATDTN